MSDQPEPGIPLSPDELARLTDMMRDTANFPEFTSTAIETVTGLQAEWYRGWIAAGVPEQRAAEWTEAMIVAQFRS